MKRWRQAATRRLTRWSARRHGRDALPLTIERRRIYILPSRFGIALALLLAAMLLAGLNYNSNLGLAFGFLMASLALVAMHHCHRNLQGLIVNAATEADAFAGGVARFHFVLQNDAAVARCDIEIRCDGNAPATHSVAAGSQCRADVDVPVRQRGIVRHAQFELRTRYPFGWFRAWTYVQTPLIAYVAPAPHGAHVLPPAAGHGSADLGAVRGDEDFAGLRDYAAGMPLKHMAWKVLARGGEPAVRSYSGGAAQPEWLDWSALEGLGAEERLSQLCRWVLDSDRDRRRYGLKLPGIEVAPGSGGAQRTACLRALAGYGDARYSDARYRDARYSDASP